MVAFFSCINGPEFDADDFFPLRVGDKFLYKLSPESDAAWFRSRKEYVEISVTREVDTLGKRYFAIENYFLPESGVEGTVYVRKEGSNVYFFDLNEEVLYYRFNSSLNSKYPVPIGITPSGIWPYAWDWMSVIQKNSSSRSQFTFHITYNNITSEYIKSVKFVKGGGRTQINSSGGGYGGPIIYDLVAVYR
jgi:hypothetical protein